MEREGRNPVRKSRIRHVAIKIRDCLRTARNRLLNRIDAPVIVLIYHRVTTLGDDPEQLAVTPENFRAQMRYLKERFPLARFEDNWSKISRPAVVITFDDGYADNTLEALPILEEVGVPATFFITTDNIDTRREFWWDDLSRIICHGGEVPDSLSGINGVASCRWPTATVNERWHCYQDLHRLMITLDSPAREGWFAHLRSWAGVAADGRETHRAVTLSELRMLAASPWVTLGAHTITHAPLSAMSIARQEAEILGSRKRLEELIGKRTEVFSYPFGNRDHYSRATRDICQQAGFVKTAANIPGNAHRWTDPQQIPRHLVRNWPVDEFAEQMNQFLLL